jgi:peptidoglycan/xylan/chitin deacetylase (PgdA/CDA1 family)
LINGDRHGAAIGGQATKCRTERSPGQKDSGLLSRLWSCSNRSQGKAPPWGAQGTHLKPGTLDRGGISSGTYGGRVGVWRIMRLLSGSTVRGTFCVNARCAEIWPEAPKAIIASGHDILQDQLLA